MRNCVALLLVVLLLLSVAAPVTAADSAVIGIAVGAEVGASMAAGFDFAAAKAQFGGMIAAARTQFFQCFPNCPALKNDESTFADLLWQKDLYYMYLLYVGAGSSPLLLDQLTGRLDGGIQPNCAEDFTSWEGSVEFYSEHFALFQGLNARFDAQKFWSALQGEAMKDYQKYKTCRDHEEFRLHARPPYNNIPAPAPRHYVETDPKKMQLKVNLTLFQLMHVTPMDPVVAPAGTPGVPSAERRSTVRLRLDSPLLGNTDGEKGTAVAVPAGVILNAIVRVYSIDSTNTNSALDVYVQPMGIAGEDYVFSNPVTYALSGWPAPNTTLIPANTPMTLTVRAAPGHYLTRADFEASAAAVAADEAHPAPKYGSRPILPGILLAITLQDTIDSSNVTSGRFFRGQVTSMTFPGSVPLPDGAIKIPTGTPVFFKVTDIPGTFGRRAEFVLDHIVLDGQNIPVVAVPWSANYTPSANPRQPAQVLWAAGSTKGFSIAEQQEVPDSGLPIVIGARANATIGSVPASPASTPPAAAAPASPAPASPVAPATSSQDRAQQAAEQRRKVIACNQQAVKDHPQDLRGQRDAMLACRQLSQQQ